MTLKRLNFHFYLQITQKMSPLTFTLLWSALCTLGYGYPDGAPVSVCDSMTPGHGTEQTGANPYSIDVSRTEYGSANFITGEFDSAGNVGIGWVVGQFSGIKPDQLTSFAMFGSYASIGSSFLST